MKKQPQDVGIRAAEIYFPSTYVAQADLEKFNGVPTGKYQVGLGQTNMACVNDREDVNSIALTAVNNLLQKNKIDPRSIGRLEVGTETLIDKSKSTKTVLMNLFKACGNHDIEGVTSINACYGATNALFNSINWVQSKSWDGRLAIVVACDVAVYPKGNARPTGGAGCIAMAIGPDAHVVFDNVRSSFMDHTYDFYKPNPTSEYPLVDGHQSIEIYLNALRMAFTNFKKKYRDAYSRTPNYYDFSYFCFHTPFSKMVQKSFFALLLEDMKQNDPMIYHPKILDELRQHDFKFSNKTNKILQKSEFNSHWIDRCERTLLLAKQLGNIYTGSLYNGLLSLLCDDEVDLGGKKIMLFSYGSGCAASLFCAHVKHGYKETTMIQNAKFQDRLAQRVKLSPQEYEEWMNRREQIFGHCKFEPQGSISQLVSGTFYLEKVDAAYRRFYTIKEPSEEDKKNEPFFNWSGAFKPVAVANKVDPVKQTMTIIDDSQEIKKILADRPVLSRLDQLDSQFVQDSKTSPITQDPAVKKVAAKANVKAKLNQKEYEAVKVITKNFHKKPLEDRMKIVKEICPEIDTPILQKGGLSPEVANYMIENCIGVMPLPLGLGLGFKVNGVSYSVPMAIEEPSVIAACSSIAKLIGEKGSGFKCRATPPVMMGQIQILDIVDYKSAEYQLKTHKRDIINYANKSCESMVARGGGVEDFRVRKLNSSVIVCELFVNVKDSMGANVINNVVEWTGPYIQDEVLNQGRVGVKILSNLCTERMVLSEFTIPIECMAWKGQSGRHVAEKIVEAQQFAEEDQFRATTHNKGVMNGIDAVAVALGQDWRAIESAAHSYASIGGYYKPLTQYQIVGEYFFGRLELPISVGSYGGAIKTNPSYENTLKMLNYPSGVELSQIMLSVGLAQNLAALRALVIEGIQKGHMNLHARNVAIRAGIPTSLINDSVNFMKKRNKITEKCALMYMEGHRVYSMKSLVKAKQGLSTLHVEINEDFLKEPLVITILFDWTDVPMQQPFNLAIEKDPKMSIEEQMLAQILFGGKKGYSWLTSFLSVLHSVRHTHSNTLKPYLMMSQNKLKLLTILANLLTTHLSIYDRKATWDFVQQLKKLIELTEHNLGNLESIKSVYMGIKQTIPRPSGGSEISEKKIDSAIIPFGFSLLLEISFIFITECQKDEVLPDLRKMIVTQFGNILCSIVEAEKVLKDKLDDSMRAVVHKMIVFLNDITILKVKDIADM